MSQRTSLPWVSLYVQGFADSPVSWGLKEHQFYTNGDNNYVLFLHPSGSYLACSYISSNNRPKSKTKKWSRRHQMLWCWYVLITFTQTKFTIILDFHFYSTLFLPLLAFILVVIRIPHCRFYICTSNTQHCWSGCDISHYKRWKTWNRNNEICIHCTIHYLKYALHYTDVSKHTLVIQNFCDLIQRQIKLTVYP